MPEAEALPLIANSRKRKQSKQRASGSESYNRTKGGSKVVVSAVIKINFVADFEPQTNRTETSFYSAAGINCAIQTRGTEAQYYARGIAIRDQAGAKPEIDEPAFQCNKGTECASWRF
jgi:hypothetical protein